MELTITYNDLRKLATMFRQPGVVLSGCGCSANKLLELEVRLDLAAFVDIAAKLGKPVPITVTVEINLSILDTRTVAVQLESLNLDKSELPIVIRPLLTSKLLRRKLFEAIPSKPGIDVDSKKERVHISLEGLPSEHPLLKHVELRRLEISAQGLFAELNLSGSAVE